MSMFAVGSYTRMGGPGIALCAREGDSLCMLDTDAAFANPIYVIAAQKGAYVYASAEDRASGEGIVASWRVEGKHFIRCDAQHTGGRAACHLTASPDERFLYVSNYLTGSLAVFPLCGEKIGACIQLLQHVGHGSNPVRQEGPHIHQAVFRPQTQELFVCDLGLDCVVVYDADMEQGTLREKMRIPSVGVGYGPRHLVFRNRDSFYLVYEMGNAITFFHWADAAWKAVQTISTVPVDYRGENTAAAIRLLDDQLYASNRGHNSIAGYSLDRLGRMRGASCRPSLGAFPRDFAFDRDGALLIAHQNEGGITLSCSNSCLSRLTCPGAVCICMLSA